MTKPLVSIGCGQEKIKQDRRLLQDRRYRNNESECNAREAPSNPPCANLNVAMDEDDHALENTMIAAARPRWSRYRRGPSAHAREAVNGAKKESQRQDQGKAQEDLAHRGGAQPAQPGERIGVVTHYYSHLSVATLRAC